MSLDFKREPTEPGWYRTKYASDFMLYSLDTAGKWHAHALDGVCVGENIPWEVIDMTGPVEQVAPYPRKVKS